MKGTILEHEMQNRCKSSHGWMISSCPLGPSLACSAVGQYWMNSKTWIASPTHTVPNVTKLWHYLRDYRGMIIGTDTKGPGQAWGCRYNRGTLEVRGYTSIIALRRTFSVCQQFLTVLVGLGKRIKNSLNARDANMKAQKYSSLFVLPCS